MDLPSVSNGTTSHSYTYGNTTWRDLLTAYDGHAISYDASGNPTTYYNGKDWTMAWAEGRRLVSANGDGKSLTFTYDSEGLRLTKKVGSTTYNYTYAGGKLLRQTGGGNTLDFFYDASGNPYALKYNGTLYYYITNLQGDVLHIVNTSGTPVVSYTYDPYGKPTVTSDTSGASLGTVNPLRYRGYVYDTETGLYYLQSRYYDPEIGRFINADAYASTGQGVLGCNMFAYCGNNPINRTDCSGQNYFYFSDYLFYALKDVLSVFVAGVSFALAALEAVIVTVVVPVTCIILLGAVTYALFSVVSATVQQIYGMAEQAVAYAQKQIQTKGIKKEDIKGHSVYVIVPFGTMDVVYVGRTSNFTKRQYSHQLAPGAKYPVGEYEMIVVASNLSFEKARAFEQLLILGYGIDTLNNIINSIAEKNWGKFVSEFQQIHGLVTSVFDPE